MADIRGAACLFYVTVGSVYTLLEGQVDTTFEGGTQTVDTYAKDSGSWGSVLPTVLNGTITIRGNMRTTNPVFEAVRQAWLNFSTVAGKIVFDKDATPNKGYSGNLRITNLQIASPATGVETYNMSLSPDEDGLDELT